jgi:hypothetical membrane protein
MIIMGLINPAFCIAGLCALVFIEGGVALSLRGFSGMKQERYSILNHFVSEGGDRRFAPHKTLFAIALIVGGVMFAPFTIGIALILPRIPAILIGVDGVFCSVSCCLVGIFPEDKEKMHFSVAACFFVGMGVLLLLLVVTYFFGLLGMFPAWVIVPSLVTLVLFVAFIVDTLSIPKWELDLTNRPWDSDPEHRPNGRPRFWRNPFLEWCSFIALAVWLAIIVAICF